MLATLVSRVVGMSDVALKAIPEESCGLALRGLATILVEANYEKP